MHTYRFAKFAFGRFRPLRTVFPLFFKSVYGYFFGSLIHEPVTLDFKTSSGRIPFRLKSLKEAHFVAGGLERREYDSPVPLGEKPVIFDCGSNTGLSVIYFRSRYPGSIVHAFEATPQHYDFLRHNVGKDGGVRLVNAAVWDKRGKSRIYFNRRNPGANSLIKTGDGAGEASVRTLKLEDYMNERGIDLIDLLKLDVEGSELKALRGLGNRIKDVRAMVGEVHSPAVGRDEFQNFLKQNGFELKWTSENPKWGTASFKAINERKLH